MARMKAGLKYIYLNYILSWAASPKLDSENEDGSKGGLCRVPV